MKKNDNYKYIILKSEQSGEQQINCLVALAEDSVVTAGRDYWKLSVWSYPHLNREEEIETFHTDEIHEIIVMDPNTLISASHDTTVRIFERQPEVSNNLFQLVEIFDNEGPVTALLKIDSMRFLAAVNVNASHSSRAQAGLVKVFSLEESQALQQLEIQPPPLNIHLSYFRQVPDQYFEERRVPNSVRPEGYSSETLISELQK